jgi:hypothetical protein
VPDSFSLNTVYGSCGTFDCSCSAYVYDNCAPGTSINYCWQ